MSELTFSEIWTGVAIGLLFGGLMRRRVSVIWLLLLVVGLALASQIPLGNWPSVSQGIFGVIGEVSVATVFLLVAWNFIPQQYYEPYQSQKRLFLLVLTLVAPPFYIAALGGTYIDPYSWGYSKIYLPGGFAIIGLFAWYLKHNIITLLISAVLIASAINMLESENLWDYVFDPLLVIYAISATLRYCYIGTKRTRKEASKKQISI